MRQIAVFRDGMLLSPEGEVINDVAQLTGSAVTALDPIDQFNAHLAQAIRLAQAMNESDKARASEVMEAARGALTMVTRLSSSEQKRFEAALRNAK
jgi:hypothetical protein